MFDVLPINGGVCAPQGFFSDGLSAGLKKEGLPDVAFIYSEELCTVDAIFTENRFQAAPLRHFKKQGVFETNFVLINAKNANAMTGEKGVEDIENLLEMLKHKHPRIYNPIMSSTGVIGVRLPLEKIMHTASQFDLSSKNPSRASKAIMTTDRYPKEIAIKVDLHGGGSFTIGAMAKGAGMINPSLATMLCFITTDARVPREDIKPLLQECAEVSFNAISVDGDTSTNDTVMLLANGVSGAYDKEAFKEALKIVMQKLAIDMVKDGEGAKKAVLFQVKGAKNYDEAKKAAKALSNSLLVKTALFGEDPNWGRIASTIGASGVECHEERLSIWFDEICVYDRGEILFSKEVEEKAAFAMKKDSLKVVCDIGVGDGEFNAYGCDLGYEYVKINADYRT